MGTEDSVARYILGARGRFEKERGVLGRFWSGGLLGNGAGERGSGTFWKKGGDWGRRQGSAVDDAWAQVQSGRHAGRGGGVSHDVDSEARSAGAERSGASD